jgi:hypothetical protein
MGRPTSVLLMPHELSVWRDTAPGMAKQRVNTKSGQPYRHSMLTIEERWPATSTLELK